MDLIVVILIATFAIAAAAFATIAITCKNRSLRRNKFVGIRLPATTVSDAAWAAGNYDTWRYSAVNAIIAGVSCVVVAGAATGSGGRVLPLIATFIASTVILGVTIAHTRAAIRNVTELANHPET